MSVNVQGSAFKKDSSNFDASVSEVNSVSSFLKDSFLDGEVARLASENKVENKDLGAITYNRTFTHEKTPESVRLERKLT